MNDQELKAHGIDVMHHFSSGVYAKQTFIPKLTKLDQHVHSYDHLSILSSGIVKLSVEGKEDKIIKGPSCLTIEKDKQHSVIAITDVVWFCIHATEDTNPETVDESILNDSH